MQRPQRLEVDRRDIGHEESGVWIAHIRASGVGERIQRQLHMQRIALARQRNLAPAEARLAHIDGDALPAGASRLDQAGQGFDDDAASPGGAHLDVGDAARAIAAGLGFAAIGVADAHEKVGAGGFRFLNN